MANTSYVLIEKITVGAAGASSVSFSGIPQTGYTDLVVKMSARATNGFVDINFNNNALNFSGIYLYGNGSSTGSGSQAKFLGPIAVTANTANAFGNLEFYVPNYTSANYKSFGADGVRETNDVNTEAHLVAGLWSNTAAITSIQIYPEGSGTFNQYSTFYLYGVAKLGTTPAIFPKATGGDTIMTDGTYWYHTFISSGTFTPASALTCDYLVVAGGGGGGSTTLGSYAHGGGGAGGMRSTVTATGGGGSLESALSLTAQAYTVTIGAGGAKGVSGNNSVFSTITSTGGGNGGWNLARTVSQGGSGGSGGGANAAYNNAPGAAGTTSQGYAGGGADDAGVTGGGGGGGAGAVGSRGGSAGAGTGRGGNGGNGVATSISGSSVTYAGGGGGGGGYENNNGVGAGTGGSGGGGNGSSAFPSTASNGTANTGGGGGGANGAPTSSSGAGGSGIVIVRYAV